MSFSDAGGTHKSGKTLVSDYRTGPLVSLIAVPTEAKILVGQVSLFDDCDDYALLVVPLTRNEATVSPVSPYYDR